MLSGRKALGRIDDTLGSARRRIEQLDAELKTFSTSVAQNRQAQVTALRELAAIRLDALRRDELAEHFDSTDRDVKHLLDERDGVLATLEERFTVESNALDSLEARRDDVHSVVDNAARALAECEANAQKALESDDAFQAQLDTTRKADAIAIGAEDKASVAQEDRVDKGKPYENDELFMYLWQRGYGTSEYRANPLARMLDAWVARLCGYREARANYWMLLEIPQRLKEHAERVREGAEHELDKLQDIEAAVATRHGVDAARAELEAAEARQDDVDQQIDASEQQLRALQEERSGFATGTDRYLAQCLDLIANMLQRRDVRELSRLAVATASAEDDALVADLRELRDDEAELERELRQSRKVYDEYRRRVDELRGVRREFKRNRFDDLHSVFENGDHIKMVIRELLRGAIQGRALWDVLRRNQRYRDVAGEWPDFGSGGIRHPRRRKSKRPPSWHWPGPSRRSRRGGFKLPKFPAPRQSRSRGGFRTGGQF